MLSTTALKRLPLHDWHLKNGARMMEYAGWLMPFQYESGIGILDSVRHTRNNASLFDVSHMLKVQIKASGTSIERFLATNAATMPIGTSKLALFLGTNGGIVDDAIICRLNEGEYQIVSNASKAHKFIEIYERHKTNLNWKIDGGSLLALQGPRSAKLLESYFGDLSHLYFMHYKGANWKESKVDIFRSGYTGEDGFELSFRDHEAAQDFAESLLKNDQVILAGLAARDILRLEAGLLLSGQDFDEAVMAEEANLSWTLPPDQPRMRPGKRLYGLIRDAGAPIPKNGQLLFESRKAVGRVTSGAFSPTLNKIILLGYLPADSKLADITYAIRGQHYETKLTKLPFVQHKYYKRKI